MGQGLWGQTKYKVKGQSPMGSIMHHSGLPDCGSNVTSSLTQAPSPPSNRSKKTRPSFNCFWSGIFVTSTRKVLICCPWGASPKRKMNNFHVRKLNIFLGSYRHLLRIGGLSRQQSSTRMSPGCLSLQQWSKAHILCFSVSSGTTLGRPLELQQCI